MSKDLQSASLLVFMAVTAFICGTLFGFNNGFEEGRFIRDLDATHNFTHNGVKE